MEPTDAELSILQNLESAIVRTLRAQPAMSDYAALRAYEGAFQLYRAEERGHAPKLPTLTGTDAAAFTTVHKICEWRLGRQRADSPAAEIPPVPLDQPLKCLRMLIKSVERHTKADGRSGYLTFIARYVQ